MEKIANSGPGFPVGLSFLDCRFEYLAVLRFLAFVWPFLRRTETPTLRLKIAVVEARVPGFWAENTFQDIGVDIDSTGCV